MLRKGSVLAGLGAIAFGILTVVGLVVGGAPGGSYDAASSTNASRSSISRRWS